MWAGAAIFCGPGFRLMAKAPKPVNPAVVPEERVAKDFPWWGERHLQKVAEARAAAKAGGVDLLFVGDSITENYEHDGPDPNQVFLPIWNQLFAPHRAMNLGFAGDLTQDVLWRLEHGEVDGLAPKDIVLLIGTNNMKSGGSAEATAEGIEAVVKELHRRMPEARILLIEVLPTSVSAVKSAEDVRVNQMLRRVYGESRYVRTLDLRALFVKDEVTDPTLFYDPYLTPPTAPIHPNSVGQRRMAAAVAAALYGH